MIIGIVVTRRISRRFGRPVIHLASDLATTFLAIPDMLFELDQNGRYLKVLSSRDMLLAAPKESLIGRTVTEMFPAKAAQTTLMALEIAKEKGRLPTVWK